MRYEDEAHRDLLLRAAQNSGVSLNDWLIMVSKRAAKAQLRSAQAQT
jgi:predicted HicB family RNase H-like nuclease